MKDNDYDIIKNILIKRGISFECIDNVLNYHILKINTGSFGFVSELIFTQQDNELLSITVIDA